MIPLQAEINAGKAFAEGGAGVSSGPSSSSGSGGPGTAVGGAAGAGAAHYAGAHGACGGATGVSWVNGGFFLVPFFCSLCTAAFLAASFWPE